ncbi:MAG: hypothetical protein KDE27_28520 [Planctomycetes bacterium]|nr:hypothetical protein [Planctomycetota bacterium]
MNSRALVAVCCFASCLAAQVGAWAKIPGDPGPPRWASGLMAFDRARGRAVLVNGSDVWESAGTSWQLAASVPNSGVFGGCFVYDDVRQRCLWFGGFAFFSNLLSEWDGAGWQPVPTAHAPSPRADTAMAYDALRQRTVLFGGWTGSGYPADTWEFDGIDWQQVFPTVSPPGTSQHRMTYDRARGEVVMYYNRFQQHGCWLYDGSTWRQTVPGPPALFVPALVYDEARAVTVLTSSSNSTAPQCDTWEWDGTSWSNPQPNGPTLGFAVNGVYDSVRGAVELLAANWDGVATWRWTGSDWQRGTPFGYLPSLPGIATAYHAPSRTAIAFGGTQSPIAGTDETFAYRRGGWQRLSPTVRPGARGDAAMAPEPSGDLLLFGGQHNGALGDSWRWNGSTWAQLAPANSPPARSQHAMATDRGRGRVVLFGGQSGAGTPLGDTWEWDGVTWLPRAPANAPVARVNAAMTYDLQRGHTLLFGGGSSTTPFTDDLWQWDGVNWTPRALALRPTARGGGRFTFDPAGGVAVLAGGFVYHVLGAYVAVNETWLWDDVQWTQVTGPAPDYDPNAVGVYHEELGSTLYSVPVPFTPTRFAVDYEFAFGSVAATSTLGTGCGGGSGAPLLSAISVPRAGNSEFALWLCNARASTLAFVGLNWSTTTTPLAGGCQAYLVAPAVTVTVTDALGNALVPLPLPASPALHGLTLHAQGAALDPGGPVAGIAVLTAGLRLVLS